MQFDDVDLKEENTTTWGIISLINGMQIREKGGGQPEIIEGSSLLCTNFKRVAANFISPPRQLLILMGIYDKASRKYAWKSVIFLPNTQLACSCDLKGERNVLHSNLISTVTTWMGKSANTSVLWTQNNTANLPMRLV